MDGKIAFTASLAAVSALLVAGAGEASAARCTLIIGASENPPVVSDGRGRFLINRTAEDTLSYRLRYNIPDAAVTQAHIHIANPGNNGGVAAFLCGGAAPVCPTPSGTVVDELGADDVREVVDEDSGFTVIEEGDLAGLFRLIRDGATYVNVHTEEHPDGEIRCQINPRIR